MLCCFAVVVAVCAVAELDFVGSFVEFDLEIHIVRGVVSTHTGIVVVIHHLIEFDGQDSVGGSTFDIVIDTRITMGEGIIESGGSIANSVGFTGERCQRIGGEATGCIGRCSVIVTRVGTHVQVAIGGVDIDSGRATCQSLPTVLEIERHCDVHHT